MSYHCTKSSPRGAERHTENASPKPPRKNTVSCTPQDGAGNGVSSIPAGSRRLRLELVKGRKLEKRGGTRYPRDYPNRPIDAGTGGKGDDRGGAPRHRVARSLQTQPPEIFLEWCPSIARQHDTAMTGDTHRRPMASYEHPRAPSETDHCNGHHDINYIVSYWRENKLPIFGPSLCPTCTVGPWTIDLGRAARDR